MQVNIGINNEVSLYGGRDFTETTPYQLIHHNKNKRC